MRNTKVADLVSHLKEYAIDVSVYDPLASPAEAIHEYGIAISNDLPKGPFQAVVLAVNHEEVKALAADLGHLLAKDGLVYDVKGVLPVMASHARV